MSAIHNIAEKSSCLKYAHIKYHLQAVWTLILTAPIHCIANSSWMAWGWIHFQQIVIFEWTIPSSKHFCKHKQKNHYDKEITFKKTLLNHYLLNIDSIYCHFKWVSIIHVHILQVYISHVVHILEFPVLCFQEGRVYESKQITFFFKKKLNDNIELNYLFENKLKSEVTLFLRP